MIKTRKKLLLAAIALTLVLWIISLETPLPKQGSFEELVIPDHAGVVWRPVRISRREKLVNAIVPEAEVEAFVQTIFDLPLRRYLGRKLNSSNEQFVLHLRSDFFASGKQEVQLRITIYTDGKLVVREGGRSKVDKNRKFVLDDESYAQLVELLMQYE